MELRHKNIRKFITKSLVFFLTFFMVMGRPLGIIATTVPVTLDSSNSTVLTSPTLQQSILMAKKIPANFLFSKTLRSGVSDTEVKYLQIILNSDYRTIVKPSGVGSTGLETSYFGPATTNAVNRFQELYKAVILTPIGLSSTTGNVGSMTRTVLNQILNNLRNGKAGYTNILESTNVSLNSPPATKNNDQSNTNQNQATSSNTQNLKFIIQNNSAYVQNDQADDLSILDPKNPIPLSIVSSYKLSDTAVNSDYSVVIMGTGSGSDFKWNLTGGALPAGLSLSPKRTNCNGSDCYSILGISGHPTNAGTSTFAIKLSADRQSVIKNFIIFVAPSELALGQKDGTQKLFSLPPNVEKYSQSLDRTRKVAMSNNMLLRNAVMSSKTVDGIAGSRPIIQSSETTRDTMLLGQVLGESTDDFGMGGIRDVFGGNIVYVQYCTCEAMIMAYIYDYDLKSTIQLMYIPGVSTLYEMYNVFEPGPLVLGGQQIASIPCLVYDGEECDNYGTAQGLIDPRGVGTTPT